MKSSPANDNLIEQTQRLWTPRLRRDLSREDARQLVENVTGFFDYSIACEVGNGGKRHLVIRAGKSHKFTIPAEEVSH
jgi:hypothetical protein